MDINELESFKLSDAVAFHKELNPKLWEDEKLDPEVRDQLLLIAEDFVEYLGISNLKVRDVTISGSNAAYSYTPHSDLDLHVLVDFDELPNNEVYQELFTAKKTLYNDAHDITVREVPVELYVQDTNNPVQSLGEYSIVHDKWIRIPKKRRANFDEVATKLKYEKLGDLIELAIKSRDPKRVNDTIALVKRYRKSGLDRAGEFGPENLAYKAVRKQGLVQALHDLKVQLHTEKLSIDEDIGSIGDQIQSQLGLKVFNLHDRGDTIELASLIVGKDKQGQGLGSKAMKMLIDYADEHGKRITLTPGLQDKIQGTTSRGRLVKFYKQFGFKESKGRNIDYALGAGKMYREPLAMSNEDYDPNGPPPGPEFKPTMPAGTVRVDVSDVYDWYKLGQHVSNLKGLGKHDFGKGPPSTILSFGDEETEHKYINDLEKTGLTTTDIDPVDPNQPKGMKRQKTDPTFNVNETADRKAAVLKIQKHLNKKYGANLDLDGKLGPLTLKSINKFMPRAKTGLADEPNKTTAVQGKKLKEAPRTLQSQVTPLEKLVQEYGYLTTFGMSHLDKQGATPEAQQELLALVQRLSKDGKTFANLDKQKMETNRDKILNHIHSMMQYAIPVLKKNLPADKWEAKRSQINSVLTAYNNARQINEASGYIPSAKEKNDPRFKTALTVDVKPDAIKKNAKAFGFKTSRAGIPPQARADGKIAEDLMREFKSFLGEQQEEMFPGYDKEHREKRLSNWLAKSWGVQNGKPQTFYHATTKDFDTFNTSGTGFASALGMAYEVERHGSFFAVDPKFAEGFIEDPNTGRVKEGGRVLPVHLSIQSPIDLRDNALSRMVSDEETADEFKANGIDLRSVYNHFYELERWELFDGPEGAEFVDNLQKLGFDGAIINEAIPDNSNAKSGQVWVAFNPSQVKSVYNRGSFSPDDPRLTKESG
jgi:GNAT superfamily N-acetyltransferase